VFLAGEKTALRKDLEMGRAIQTLLLPRATDGRIGPWEYRIIYRPYGPMSGDWFQVHATPEAGGRSLIAIGDVVGKGPSAALNTAVVASIWRTWEARWRRGDGDVAAFAQALHEAIALAFHGEQFSTLSLCELTDDAIRMVAAAAPRWVYLSAEDGPVQAHVSAAGNPLGIAPVDGGPFPPMDVWAVAPKVGDIFVAYTDGVLDRFGRSLLMRSVRERPPTGPLGFGELEDLVIEAAGPQGQEDDFTLMMVRYAGHGNVTELPVPASQTQLQSAS
jgi:serine phosphatase RsbU (regulator of sigma subunit)